MSISPATLEALVDWYATLTPTSLGRLPEFYAEHCHFRDPFNELHSRAQLQRLYTHMFETLQQPRFVFRRQLLDGNQAFLIWDMTFRLRGEDWCIHGGSHLEFDADGRVGHHRDYWDAAAEVYEKIPVLGWLLRRLRKSLQTAEST